MYTHPNWTGPDHEMIAKRKLEQMKTSELTGAALDWLVAKCVLGNNFRYCHVGNGLIIYHDPGDNRRVLAYSTDWAQGGPIIEREELSLQRVGVFGKGDNVVGPWASSGNGNSGYGPTPLIAAMRCFVVSKLGDEVEIPSPRALPRPARRGSS